MKNTKITKIMKLISITLALLTLVMGAYILLSYTVPRVCIAIYPTPFECTVPQYQHYWIVQTGISLQILLAAVYSGLTLSEYIRIKKVK
jgi:hypothetical protein